MTRWVFIHKAVQTHSPLWDLFWDPRGAPDENRKANDEDTALRTRQNRGDPRPARLDGKRRR